MINNIIKGKAKDLALLVAALAALNSCSKKSNPLAVESLPNYKDAKISMEIEPDQDSAYCRVRIYSSDPCSVRVEIKDKDSVLAVKEDYVKDSLEYIFRGLPVPLQGSVIASNNREFYRYFSFSETEGIGDINSTFDSSLVEQEERAYQKIETPQVNMTKADTMKIELPDTLSQPDTLENKIKDSDKQGLFKKMFSQRDSNNDHKNGFDVKYALNHDYSNKPKFYRRG
jgi:hypothetical protein